ncbi:MAG TPA: hypothetical protein PL029_02660 [Bacteroidia bacterium]|nr:hypothetical protein [Bacteroidia bacterium]
MSDSRRYFLFGFFVLAFVLIRAETPAVQGNTTIAASLRDSTAVSVSSPSSDQEASVFSDRKLRYKQEVKAGPGVFETFMRALARLLFESASTENLLRTRQIIIWTVVIVSLIVIARLLAKSGIGKLTRANPKLTGFNFNDLTEDLATINYAQRIAEALSENNFRLAIRWHYLEMLYQLDKQQLIVFAPYKTNIDYRYELKNKNIQAVFTSLSRIYDYVWYGQFVISETEYVNNAGAFLNLKKQIHV